METYNVNIINAGEANESKTLDIIDTPPQRTKTFTEPQIERMIVKMALQIAHYTEQKALWEKRKTEINK